MFEPLYVQSHRGVYEVFFDNCISFDDMPAEFFDTSHFIVDNQVAKIYSHALQKILNSSSVLLLDATEHNKSLENFPHYVTHLVNRGIRRHHRLIAIGGGIIQDITCFLSATLLRGVKWWYYPTTLLSQADSCIGSKSSINCNGIKNILGTYTPPKKIYIDIRFLDTLNKTEIQSGIGEMLKVHAIQGASAFDQIAKSYDQLLADPSILLPHLFRSLQIKKNIIEQDEFDVGFRHIMNYGHTFGHAVESATQYQIPHGIAVTIGMDMANYIAYQLNVTDKTHYDRMHPVLKKNYHSYMNHFISPDLFFSALLKDKKNTNQDEISTILLNKDGAVVKTPLKNNQLFTNQCKDYLSNGRCL